MLVSLSAELSLGSSRLDGSRGQIQRTQISCSINLLGSINSHAGFAIGGMSNYHSSLEMMSALSKSHGTRTHFAGNGRAILDGPIGSSTFLSLSEQYAEYDIELLELISGGGLIEEATNIGLFLREKGIATYVQNWFLALPYG